MGSNRIYALIVCVRAFMCAAGLCFRPCPPVQWTRKPIKSPDKTSRKQNCNFQRENSNSREIWCWFQRARCVPFCVHVALSLAPSIEHMRATWRKLQCHWCVATYTSSNWNIQCAWLLSRAFDADHFLCVCFTFFFFFSAVTHCLCVCV